MLFYCAFKISTWHLTKGGNAGRDNTTKNKHGPRVLNYFRMDFFSLKKQLDLLLENTSECSFSVVSLMRILVSFLVCMVNMNLKLAADKFNLVKQWLETGKPPAWLYTKLKKIHQLHFGHIKCKITTVILTLQFLYRQNEWEAACY